MGTFDEKAESSAANPSSAEEGNRTETSGISKRPASGPRPIDPLDGPVPASLAWTDGPVAASGAKPGTETGEGQAASDEPSADDEPDPYLGTVISDRYVVDDVLGAGGMGRVYLAHHKVIGKKVAVKILHAELAKDKKSVGRFVREAQAPHRASATRTSSTSPTSARPPTAPLTSSWSTSRATTLARPDRRRTARLHPDHVVRHRLAAVRRPRRGAQARRSSTATSSPTTSRWSSRARSNDFCKILDFGIAKVSTGASCTKLTHGGRGVRHAALHVAGAGGGRGRRSPHRHLLARRDALRDGQRAGCPSTPRTSWGS